MNSSENLKNALEVMYKTYDNVKKLMDYCISFAGEKTEYDCFSDKSLRWKTGVSPESWLTNSFILLFQNRNSKDCDSDNGWKNDSIYAMEICLGEKGKTNPPLIYLSRFEYHDINAWSKGCSTSDFWGFFNPIRRNDDMDFSEEGDFRVGVPKNQKSSDTYWGLKKVVTKTVDLFDITAENVGEKIFNEFDRLANIE
ncbi:MAG: hypothetical protein BWX78_01226 [Firmicutes bacterium ADurb.Bin099]|nr:MAG: hypothetical protein BWX78_01226 [Firmicutes bacterium ADurb.Bin099]